MNNDKFGGTEYKFIFQLNIFYNKYQLVGLLSDAFLEIVSIILTDKTYIHFYLNCDFLYYLRIFTKR